MLSVLIGCDQGTHFRAQFSICNMNACKLVRSSNIKLNVEVSCDNVMQLCLVGVSYKSKWMPMVAFSFIIYSSFIHTILICHEGKFIALVYNGVDKTV